eukprot:CAMPEP_0115086546 /NCGR_PEP_ID=MMETSP0227-20121206/22653_1 /TAXON_ID=89957 /ORGANISM="Polarella glacialis, Strain CCMP 1383" /LENGTH=86 /DNA_ID=CAMNT_0002476031 /DNA_START=264 /DNA_END=524 /DNA_ORIENTATION=-
MPGAFDGGGAGRVRVAELGLLMVEALRLPCVEPGREPQLLWTDPRDLSRSLGALGTDSLEELPSRNTTWPHSLEFDQLFLPERVKL